MTTDVEADSLETETPELLGIKGVQVLLPENQPENLTPLETPLLIPPPQQVCLFSISLTLAMAAARISAQLGNRAIIPPTIPTNYGQTALPPPPSQGPLAITGAPHSSYQPAPPPPSSGPSAPAPPPPSIGVVVKKDERGPLGDVYQQDGEWMKDIEINNLRNRYLLTKTATQQQVSFPFLSFVSLTP
jgi:hypothetical protein